MRNGLAMAEFYHLRPSQSTLITIQALTLRHESLEEEDNEHDVSLKPFVGTLRVRSPSGRAWPAAGSESCVVSG
jgi:hypothetical protein